MRKKNSGFTLIELMVTVAIVGILAGIAYPSYRQSILKSNRTDAKAILNSYSEGLERCYTRFFKYHWIANATDCPQAFKLEGAGFDTTPSGNYKITGTITDTAYTLTATPQGGQADDTKCGSLKIDNLNNRTVSTATPPTQCW